MRVIGLVLAAVLAACSPTSDVIRLKKLESRYELVLALDFTVGTDGSIHSGGDPKSPNAVRVTLSCDPAMAKRKAATIHFHGVEIADHYFKPDPTADVSPDAGTWQLVNGTPSLIGEVFEGDHSFRTKESREYNFDVIHEIVLGMRDAKTVKIGQLDSLKFTDPDDLIGKFLSTCWPTTPGTTGPVAVPGGSESMPDDSPEESAGEAAVPEMVAQISPEPTDSATPRKPTDDTPTSPALIVRPEWAYAPSGEDFIRHYPDRAAQLGLDGRATIECSVHGLGRLIDCAVISESPVEAGFGEAALRLSKLYKMKPKTFDGDPTAGSRVRFPIEFKYPSS